MRVVVSWRAWLLAVGIGAIVLAIILLVPHNQPTAPQAEMAPVLEPAPAGAQPVASAPGGTKPQSRSSRVRTAARLPSIVSFRASYVIATVNGVRITGKDLIAIGAAESNEEKTMSPEMYAFLLQRAIDRELAFQEAQKQGLTVDASQQHQLDQYRASLTNGYPGFRMIEPAKVDEATIDFETRDAQGLMLQNALLAKSGAPAPGITEAQVKQYYAEHASEFSELPADPIQREAAWQAIDNQIRQEHAAEIEAEYQNRLRQYLEQLRAKANIDETLFTDSATESKGGVTN